MSVHSLKNMHIFSGAQNRSFSIQNKMKLCDDLECYNYTSHIRVLLRLHNGTIKH